MTSKEVRDYTLTGGLLLGAYLFGKKILEAFNIIKTKEEKESDSNIDKELAECIKKGKPTKTKGEWQIIAENIYEALKYSSISDEKNIAFMQIMRVKNNADFCLLYSIYGKRQLYFFGLPAGGKKNLLQAAGSDLNKSTKQKINNSYAAKGIKYRIP
jgi:hypothetical protein